MFQQSSGGNNIQQCFYESILWSHGVDWTVSEEQGIFSVKEMRMEKDRI